MNAVLDGRSAGRVRADDSKRRPHRRACASRDRPLGLGRALAVGQCDPAYGSPESVALGWLPSGEALIHYPSGPCGGSQVGRGIYAVPQKGSPRLIRRTPRFAQYLMWGG